MVPFVKEDVVAHDVMWRDDGTPIAVLVKLKDGSSLTIQVEHLDEEGRGFFGIAGTQK